MAGIEAAFEPLQPVALLDMPRGVAVGLGDACPFEIGEFGLVLRRSHIGPHHATTLETRIGRGLNACLQIVVARLARQVDAVALDIEFPAVIDAAQPALLIAPEEQRGGAVRALLAKKADAALA